MKVTYSLLSAVAILAFCMLSCQKLTVIPKAGNADKSAAMITNASPPSNTYIDSFDAVNHDGDSTETATILGSQLTNPYLVPNMQQAYANLGITNVSVTVTHKYIRFKPTISQLSYLDSFMDAQNLELFDAPLDYQILLEGDYYQDPSIPMEQPTWQYAVVPLNFTFPSGVQNEVLAQIHIPGDNYTAVETEAERLATLGGGGAANATDGGAQPNAPQCPDGYHWDFDVQDCVPNTPTCPTGYHWNGSSCVPDQTSPPAPAPDAAVPAGYISVDETQQLSGLLRSSTPNATYYRAPIRKATVVARRWFKTERVYTDNNGRFQFTKRFKHKVRINVKFKNDDAIVKGMRGFRLWQVLFPMKKTFGVFSSNKTSIDYNFQKYNTSVHAKGNTSWAGASVLNAVQEYKDIAATENIGQPQGKIRILVTNLLGGHGAGSTPMFNKRWISQLPQDFVELYIVSSVNSVAGGLTAIVQVLQHEVDMTISYNAATSNYSNFYSDDLKETTYHELTHAGQYLKLGSGWYTQFVNSELNAITGNIGNGKSPYGDGTASYSPIIGLGESWAYHMGQYIADKQYGANSTSAGEQTTSYSNGSGGLGLNCHLVALELYDPNLNGYPFDWIPKGLYYDMLDTHNESFPVIDGVNGYTNQQFFNGFNSTITSMEAYRINFLQQYNITATAATAVNNLFAQYHH